MILESTAVFDSVIIMFVLSLDYCLVLVLLHRDDLLAVAFAHPCSVWHPIFSALKFTRGMSPYPSEV